jgi:ketosteroid isomerase-like protein
VIREAYEALGNGELELLVALMDDDVEWRGRRSSVQFWRPPPS